MKDNNHNNEPKVDINPAYMLIFQKNITVMQELTKQVKVLNENMVALNEWCADAEGFMDEISEVASHKEEEGINWQDIRTIFIKLFGDKELPNEEEEEGPEFDYK